MVSDLISDILIMVTYSFSNFKLAYNYKKTNNT